MSLGQKLPELKEKQNEREKAPLPQGSPTVIKILTDYPFESLGDTLGKIAPARVVDAVWYDGNKYVGLILPNGERADIKAGYCYALNAKNGYRVNPAVFSLPEFTNWDQYNEANRG